jgi:hypothetical protein
MKYMLLVYHNEQSFAELGEATHAAMLEESIRLAHKVTSNGQYLAAPLQPTSTATCVRVRDGKRMVPMRRHTSNLLDTFLSKPKTSTKRSASPLECLEHGSALWRFDRSEMCRVCQRHKKSKMRSRAVVDFASTARAGTCRSARA